MRRTETVIKIGRDRIFRAIIFLIFMVGILGHWFYLNYL
jgi:hypothetical protein